MKTTYHGHITFGLIGGEDHEYPAKIDLSFSQRCPAVWDKAMGTWLPPDEGEIEVLRGQVNIDKQWYDIPQWFLDSVQADQEAIYHFDEFIADELNRTADD